VLPVLSLLIIGSGVMGAIALREFALALLVGLITGSYSSIFIAAPILTMLHEREPRYRSLRLAHATGADLERLVLGGSPGGHKRESARTRRSTTEVTTPGGIAAPPAPATPQSVLTHAPRPRKKKRR
jgi:preprotein translocase subunit SecF